MIVKLKQTFLQVLAVNKSDVQQAVRHYKETLSRDTWRLLFQPMRGGILGREGRRRLIGGGS
jgi:hypothetical protein